MFTAAVKIDPHVDESLMHVGLTMAWANMEGSGVGEWIPVTPPDCETPSIGDPRILFVVRE